MKVLLINEFKESHNNDYLAFLIPVLQNAGCSVEVDDDRLLDDFENIHKLNEYDKVISTCHEMKHMIKWDGLIKFDYICLNHSYGGPTHFNEYPLTLFKKFDKSYNKLFLVLPKFYVSLFGHSYESNVILTESYFKLLKLYQDCSLIKDSNTKKYVTYYAHWTTNLQTLLEICEKYSRKASELGKIFRVRLHPLFYSTYKKNNDMMLVRHHITYEQYNNFHTVLTSNYCIDQTPLLVQSIYDTSHYIFDGMSNTITEAITINNYLSQKDKEYSFENSNQVLDWSTEYDREIALKYFYAVNPDYQIGQFTNLDPLWENLEEPSARNVTVNK
jgi:hypothetical protein